MSKKDFNEILGMGKDYYRNDEYLNTLDFYNYALIIAQKNKLNEEECNILINQAGTLYRLASFKEAEEFYHRALKNAQKYELKQQECGIYNFLTIIYEMLNDYTKAVESLEEGFKICAIINDNSSKAKLLNTKGVYYHIFGRNEDSLKCYQEAMEYYQKSNNTRGVGTSCNLIAGHYSVINNYDESLKFYFMAKKTGEELPDFEMMALATCRISKIYSLQNNKENAINIIPELEVLEEKSENRKVTSEIYHVKGLIYQLLEQRDLAISNYEKAIQSAKAIDLKYLQARIYKDMGIFYLEIGETETAYDNLMLCNDIFNLIRERIDDQNDRKNYEDSNQTIVELIWSLSKIINKKIPKLDRIEDIVLNLCKLTRNNSNDYALKLHIKIISKSIVEKLKIEKVQLEADNINLEEDRKRLSDEGLKLREKVHKLEQKLRNYEIEFKRIKANPQSYTGLDKEYLKDFINTEMWADSRDQLIKQYFFNVFDDLADNSKNELVFMRTIYNLMDSGYELCTFLLTKVVEREMRRVILRNFKLHWRKNLKRSKFRIYWKNSKLNHFKEKNIRKTHEIFLDYLNDKSSPTLGNISYILTEIKDYCNDRNNKKYLLNWEKHFLRVFKGDICNSISNILNGLSFNIPSKKDSIKFIDLRNLVSHPNDIEPEIKSYKKIEFDKTFVTNLLELMTIKNPKLLIEICKIEPK